MTLKTHAFKRGDNILSAGTFYNVLPFGKFKDCCECFILSYFCSELKFEDGGRVLVSHFHCVTLGFNISIQSEMKTGGP